MIKVSVILPSLNVADYIEECIKSAMNQTLEEMEILSVDAGSLDGTVDILKRCAEMDTRIRLLHSDVKSYGRQVNLGVHAARGKYIAILETDDYVEPNMYEQLYTWAEANELDFVLADFARFSYNPAGRKTISEVADCKDIPHIYGKVLNPAMLKELYHLNQNLWRGIYRKEFMIQNDIILNETPGAAYQDIDFMHRVMMHAKRGMYVEESYYRYRTDRIESSVNSPNGIRYVWQEYRQLFEQNEVVQGFETRVYYMLANSLLNQMKGIFPWIDEQWKKENSKYYLQIREWIVEGIGKGFISEKEFGKERWSGLQVLLRSMEEYLLRLKYPGNLRQLVSQIGSQRAIIFGAGRRGLFLKSRLSTDVYVDAFCDNNEKLWGNKQDDIPVLSLKKCIQHYPKDVYIITIKGAEEAIRDQLIAEGINEGKILTFTMESEG